MKTLDLTLPAPAANLACDEALLDLCEEAAAVAAPIPNRSGGLGVLRFWESSEHFVVVGYSNKIATEVNVGACARCSVPILRRCSGGGTVVQGPGCLNYALILPIGFPFGGRSGVPAATGRPLETVTGTNRYIMEGHRDVIQKLLESRSGPPRRVNVPPRTPSGSRVLLGPDQSPDQDRRDACPTIVFDGHTDLALEGRKFSGNSQRRRQHCILFHGTFLLDFDLALVAELLRFPSKQPRYRQGRAHADFLTNLPVPAATVKAALRQTWGASEALPFIPKVGQASCLSDSSAAPAGHVREGLATPKAFGAVRLPAVAGLSYSAAGGSEIAVREQLHNRIARLVQEKYATRAWNEKF